MNVYEGYIYLQKDCFLKNYFQFLAKCKMIHEALPSQDPEEIKAYVAKVNETMKFSGKNLLTVEELEPNSIKKYHVKNFMNQVKKAVWHFPTQLFLY